MTLFLQVILRGQMNQDQTKNEASFEAPPVENLPIEPVDESAFFNDAAVEDSDNNLEEDVPF